jgi:hypothetical protein
MPNQPRRKQSTQNWMTFIRNHAKSIIACDFFVVVRPLSTWSMCSSSWKLPNAEWTIQQFRECLTEKERYRFVIHDRDAICSKDVDLLLKMTGLQILKTPTQSPQAKAYASSLHLSMANC